MVFSPWLACESNEGGGLAFLAPGAAGRRNLLSRRTFKAALEP